MTSTPLLRHSYSSKRDKEQVINSAFLLKTMTQFKKSQLTKPLITPSFTKSIANSNQSQSSYGLVDLSLNFDAVPKKPVSISPFLISHPQHNHYLDLISNQNKYIVTHTQKENILNSDHFYPKLQSKSQILNRIKKEVEASKKKTFLAEKLNFVNKDLNTFETLTRICKARNSLQKISHEGKSITNLKYRKLKSQDFKKISQIGEGEFSKVYLVVQKATNWLCILKVIKRNMADIQSTIREIKLQLWVQHPNVVSCYGFFGDENNIYIIQEYCLGGSLRIPRSIKEKKMIVADVFEGVAYLHSQGILHRDLKLENIVSVFNVSKICDFGFSVFASGQTRSTFCGTPNFISPELVQGFSYNEKNDVWALGILTYLIFYGTVPFPVIRNEDMLNIVSEELRFPFQNEQMQPVVQVMLQKNVNRRPTMNVIMALPVIQQCLKINQVKKHKQSYL